MKRAAALLLALGLALTGCAIETTDSNEVGLHYKAGPLEGKGYAGLVGPNQRHTMDVFGSPDDFYRYPIDQRSWASGIDRGPVEFVSKDGLRLQAEFEVRFKLNQNEDVLRDFHETVGRKHKAWTDEGWVNMLREYVDKEFERAVDSAGLKHNWRDLRENEETRLQFAADASRRFSANLERAIGGQFFCGLEHNGADQPCGDVYFAIGQPNPVDVKVVEAIESEQAARAQTQALSAEEARAKAEAQARQVLIDQLGPANFICLEAIRAARETGNAPPPCFANVTPAPVTEVG